MGYVIIRGEDVFSSPDTIVVNLDALEGDNIYRLKTLVKKATEARLFHIAYEAQARLDELEGAMLKSEIEGASLVRGLAQSAAGETEYLGDFSQYATDPSEEPVYYSMAEEEWEAIQKEYPFDQ